MPETTTSAAIRSGVERGDPFAVVRDGAVSLRINPSERVGAPGNASFAARADHPVADDPHSPTPQVEIVAADTDGQDTDAMEHERQSRRSRWQRLPE